MTWVLVIDLTRHTTRFILDGFAVLFPLQIHNPRSQVQRTHTDRPNRTGQTKSHSGTDRNLTRTQTGRRSHTHHSRGQRGDARISAERSAAGRRERLSPLPRQSPAPPPPPPGRQPARGAQQHEGHQAQHCRRSARSAPPGAHRHGPRAAHG